MPYKEKHAELLFLSYETIYNKIIDMAKIKITLAIFNAC
jgi:hypothetical protein